jgi:signal transduction histidine kinase
MGYTNLLLDDTFGSLTTEQVEVLRRVDKNARELLDLISAVLDVSSMAAGRLSVESREVQVPELLKEIESETQELYEHSGLEFAQHVEANLPTLRTDPGKLKVVIKNLLGNAAKFTEKGRVTLDAHASEGGVEIRVTDTGVGIPAGSLAVIFEPFQQLDSGAASRQRGTGLGLHIVKRLLELLGGRVSVESVVGHGSTFRVWIPVSGSDEYKHS